MPSILASLTPALLLRLWEREATLLHEADLVRAMAERHCSARCVASRASDDCGEAALRIVRQADAFGATMQRLYETLDYDALIRPAERLQHMRRYPTNYPVSALLAERERLGVTVEWCERRGRIAA